MHAPVNHRLTAALYAAAALLLGTLVVAPQADAGTLYACVKKNGSAHIFAKKPKCKKGESMLSWAKEGPGGKGGANGSEGPQGKEGKEGSQGKEGKEGQRGLTGLPGVAPNVFVGNKAMAAEALGFASLMSVGIPAGSAAGGSISFTILATDGGSQVVTEVGTILWDATTNTITCTLEPGSTRSIGEVNAGCTPGFFNPGSQPGISIYDNVKFPSPKPIVVNHVWFTIINNSGDSIRLE